MRSLYTTLALLVAASPAFAAVPPNSVPEPGTLALVGLAAAAAFVLRKRK